MFVFTTAFVDLRHGVRSTQKTVLAPPVARQQCTGMNRQDEVRLYTKHSGRIRSRPRIKICPYRTVVLLVLLVAYQSTGGTGVCVLLLLGRSEVCGCTAAVGIMLFGASQKSSSAGGRQLGSFEDLSHQLGLPTRRLCFKLATYRRLHVYLHRSIVLCNLPYTRVLEM